MGAKGCWVNNSDGATYIPSKKVTAVDTTAAGDSFNAAYIASRIQGASPSISAVRGSELAAKVVQNKGAIIPRF